MKVVDSKGIPCNTREQWVKILKIFPSEISEMEVLKIRIGSSLVHSISDTTNTREVQFQDTDPHSLREIHIFRYSNVFWNGLGCTYIHESTIFRESNTSERFPETLTLFIPVGSIRTENNILGSILRLHSCGKM